MKTVFLADIHSNLEALDRAEKEIKKINPDKVVCLGDIVGYGADPDGCVERVRLNRWSCLMGNHDLAAAGKMDLARFNPLAKESLAWTKDKLKEESKDYLRSLPFVWEDSFLAGVHSSLFEPNQFYYLDNYSDIRRDFSLLETEEIKICFVAHTHIPSIFVYRNQDLYRDYSSQVEIKEKSNYLINVGSIGQPRDCNPDICFCLWDSDLNTVSFIRKSYDIKKAQEKIERAGLSFLLSQRLQKGW
jgi:predicted phosphodiesterase